MTDERAAVELKACPFCGAPAARDDAPDLPLVECSAHCGLFPVVCYHTDEGGSERVDREWNTRPIEDALRAENTDLSARVSELTRLLAEAERALWKISPLDVNGDIDMDAFEIEHWHEWLALPAVQRALQSGEGGNT